MHQIKKYLSMKEKILSSIKKMKQKSLAINVVIPTTMFLAVIVLSLKSDGLFFKELMVGGSIVLLALLYAKGQDYNN